MKTIVVASVHTNDKNTYSSTNFNGYKEFSSAVKAIKWIENNKVCFGDLSESYNDNELGISIFYLPVLENNYMRKEFENLFTHGFSDDVQKYWDKQENIENDKRKDLGFVIHKKYEDIVSPNDYVGNLNKSLTQYVLQYIQNKGVFGYLGHSWRQCRQDEFIEEFIDTINVVVDGVLVDKWYLVGLWLTSSDARHWMDYFEDNLENVEKSLEYFKEKFKRDIDTIMLTAYVYSLPEHDGSWNATRYLFVEYKNRLMINKTNL